MCCLSRSTVCAIQVGFDCVAHGNDPDAMALPSVYSPRMWLPGLIHDPRLGIQPVSVPSSKWSVKPVGGGGRAFNSTGKCNW